MGDTPETATPAVDPAVTTPAPPQYLTKEEAKQLVDDAIERGRSVGRREMQSEKDKDVRDAIRRAQQAERELQAMGPALDGLDDNIKTDIENRRLRSRVQDVDAERAQEEYQRRAGETIAAFEEDQKEHVTDLGIDLNDKRIEWGNSSEMDLRVRNKTFLASIRKIQKAGNEASKTEIAKLVRTEIEKRDNAAGIHSVDTAVGTGVAKNKNWEEVRAAFIKDPYDPEVRARYNEMRTKKH